MDKYEAIRQYRDAAKAYSKARGDLTRAEEAARNANTEKERAETRLRGVMTRAEAVIFEGEVWTIDEYGVKNRTLA